ncbi:DUF6578 domain-containing protein [Streptomyces sp. NPDC052496]|uniref:DUF6578 domain-containing protein n=1 Tax=Streptomyces sp. NPDC052496 TaxID=3154951 RepID=UPI003429EE45
MTDTGSGRTVRVLHRDWEMECCGTPFSVGDQVAWPLVFEDVAAADAAVWADCLDERGLLRVATLHGGAPDTGSGAPRLAGRVRSIQVVIVGYRDAEPVPGERWLRPVERCPKRFSDRVVDLEDAEDVGQRGGRERRDRTGGKGPGGSGRTVGTGRSAGAYRRVECGVIVEVDVAGEECGT